MLIIKINFEKSAFSLLVIQDKRISGNSPILEWRTDSERKMLATHLMAMANGYEVKSLEEVTRPLTSSVEPAVK